MVVSCARASLMALLWIFPVPTSISSCATTNSNRNRSACGGTTLARCQGGSRDAIRSGLTPTISASCERKVSFLNQGTCAAVRRRDAGPGQWSWPQATKTSMACLASAVFWLVRPESTAPNVYYDKESPNLQTQPCGTAKRAKQGCTQVLRIPDVTATGAGKTQMFHR